MAEIIDLNALVPESRIVKIGDKEIEIKPPKTSDMIKLGSIGQRMQGAKDLSPAEVDEVVSSMTELLKEMIPELNEVELYASQVFKLFEIISEMVNPEISGGQTETPKVEQS